MYLWLCQCYGPNWFSRSDFDYWARIYFHKGIDTDSILNTLRIDGWVSVSNSGEVRMEKCEQTRQKLVRRGPIESLPE